MTEFIASGLSSVNAETLQQALQSSQFQELEAVEMPDVSEEQTIIADGILDFNCADEDLSKNSSNSQKISGYLKIYSVFFSRSRTHHISSNVRGGISGTTQARTGARETAAMSVLFDGVRETSYSR